MALIRDLRRCVAVEPAAPEAQVACNEPSWQQEGWQATAAPAAQMMPKLIPIVTTATTIEAVELAQIYIRRWPVQENVIKDYLLPLGLDTNHGFAKTPVENSEVAKRRASLQHRLSRLNQWEISARKRPTSAEKRRERLQAQKQRHARPSYRQLRLDQRTWEQQGVAEQVIERQLKQHKARIHDELRQIRIKEGEAEECSNHELGKLERYCRQQREVLRALEDVEAQERTMYELDHRKDQVMTVCKVALANLAMWVRDQYFPLSYAHASLPAFASVLPTPWHHYVRCDHDPGGTVSFQRSRPQS